MTREQLCVKGGCVTLYMPSYWESRALGGMIAILKLGKWEMKIHMECSTSPCKVYAIITRRGMLPGDVLLAKWNPEKKRWDIEPHDWLDVFLKDRDFITLLRASVKFMAQR